MYFLPFCNLWEDWISNLLMLLPLLFMLFIKYYFILYSPPWIEFLTKDVLKCLGLISFSASSWCLEREKLERNKYGGCVLVSLWGPWSECEHCRYWQGLHMQRDLCFGEAWPSQPRPWDQRVQKMCSPSTVCSFQFSPSSGCSHEQFFEDHTPPPPPFWD